MNWTRRLLLNAGRDAAAAVRSLRATPGFTVVAVLVLTLGTGASTAIFSVVDAVMLRGLPFDEADRLVSVREVSRRGGLNLAGPQNYIDWKAASDVVSSLAAIRSGSLDLKRDGA